MEQAVRDFNISSVEVQRITQVVEVQVPGVMPAVPVVPVAVVLVEAWTELPVGLIVQLTL